MIVLRTFFFQEVHNLVIEEYHTLKKAINDKEEETRHRESLLESKIQELERLSQPLTSGALSSLEVSGTGIPKGACCRRVLLKTRNWHVYLLFQADTKLVMLIRLQHPQLHLLRLHHHLQHNQRAKVS